MAVSQYFNVMNKMFFNEISVYDFGIKVLDMIEIIHGAGYVHNDISLDKIHLGTNQKFNLIRRRRYEVFESMFDDKSLHIIDFTFMTPYINFETGKHLKKEKVNNILNVGNELQTLNRLDSFRTSRRDDLEMLCYLLISISRYYRIPNMEFPKGSSKNKEHMLYYLHAYKKNYPLSRLCKILLD